MAIYALILHQANKNDQHPPTNLQNLKFSPAHLGSTDNYNIAKYQYFDQAVYLFTSKEDNRKLMVFEDGTSYEVIDTKEGQPGRKIRSDRFSSVAFTSGLWQK